MCKQAQVCRTSFRRALNGITVAFVILQHHSESFSIISNRRHGNVQVRHAQSDEADIGNSNNPYNMNMGEKSPIPVMPSDMFQRMAMSQLELLANSLIIPDDPTASKVDSMALYLPQENVNTGQLEFTPVVLYPDPTSERVFIASDAASGQAPTLPPTLTKLPGFAHANTLLPQYPMMASDQVNPGVGIVEEVMCDVRFKNRAAALSVPLLSGSQTVGVLLVSPSVASSPPEVIWTELDRDQVSRAAQSLSMALSMDNERNYLREQNNAFRDGLSDSLHQVKNPLQALRTYGKILQRQIAESEELGDRTRPLLELTDRLMIQSERVVDLMVPMDALVENLEESTRRALQPAEVVIAPQPLTRRLEASLSLPWEEETLEFARGNITTSDTIEPLEYKNIARGIMLPAAASPTPSTISQKAKKSPSTIVGDLALEMTFVSDVLEPVLSASRAIASELGVHFEVIEDSSELPGVIAAPKSLQEALSNILDNALKYVVLPKVGTPLSRNPSPHIRVRIFPNKPEQPGVTILVEDNGPGISKEERQEVFERGYRSEATRGVKGSGIGLDISQVLIQRMGGLLEVATDGEFENMLDGAVLKCILFRKPSR